MGQIVKRKKKGRPAKAESGTRETAQELDLRRSLRRRNVKYVFGLDDYFEDDEDQRRREKKLKLQSGVEPESTAPQPSRTLRADHVPATSASSSDDGDKPSKKRKIDEEIDEDMDEENGDVNDEDNYNDENDEEIRERKPEPKAEDSPPGTPAEAQSGLPLPDKALELILDELQKKDIYGAYAEPVDPEELPDYHDVIKHPMDFSTVRNKLGNGSYANLEQFESDVFLICSNAMQYNALDTIYHKQASSIKELAIKKFHKIRLNAECSEKDVKPEQKMRSSSILKKQIKRSVSQTVQEPIGSDFSSGATLATAVDIHNVSNVQQAVECERPGNIGVLVEGNSFLNDNNLDKGEESLPGKDPLSRFGRKSFVHDENRRVTYSISLAHPVASSESMFSTFGGENKLLVPVGLYSDHSYARSLARFAAIHGSVAWKVTSKRIEQALPQGFKFGRGWVGEYEPLPPPILMLDNCTVNEAPFFAEVQSDADRRKFLNIPMISVSSKESEGSGPFLGNKLPFLGPAGTTPPSAPSINASLPVKEHPIRVNVSEMEPSFFLSPGIKRSGSANLSYQHQNPRSRRSVGSDKKVLKQVELEGPPSFNRNAADFIGHKQSSKCSEMEASRSIEFASRNINFSPSESFQQSRSNGVSVEGLLTGKVVGNILDTNTIASSSSDLAKAASYSHEQGQGPSDPVHLMRMWAEKAQNQQKSSNQSAANAPQVLSSAPSSSCNDSNNAAVAAASEWMPVGAGGFRPAGENTILHKNQISADSLYNSTRDIHPQVARFRGDFPATGMHVQPDGNNAARHALVPQGSIPIRVGNEIQYQNQPMVFPQLVTADSSRFQLQSTWRNLSPQMHSRQKQESFPPDLNIGFQSSGSPGRPLPDVLVDSQQPDLALQL